MSDDDEVTASLLKFAPKVPTTPEQAARLQRPEGEKTEYRAADIERTPNRVKRILVELSNGDINLVSYSYFVEAISTSDRMMGFIYTNGGFYIDGENLRLLLPDLQDESIKALRPFDPDKHLDPEDGAPIITRLEWRTIDQMTGRS